LLPFELLLAPFEPFLAPFEPFLALFEPSLSLFEPFLTLFEPTLALFEPSLSMLEGELTDFEALEARFEPLLSRLQFSDILPQSVMTFGNHPDIRSKAFGHDVEIPSRPDAFIRDVSSDGVEPRVQFFIGHASHPEQRARLMPDENRAFAPKLRRPRPFLPPLW
jgi:hypothetical protein